MDADAPFSIWLGWVWHSIALLTIEYLFFASIFIPLNIWRDSVKQSTKEGS